jgi:transposase-like protein
VNILSNLKAAEKIIYLTLQNLQERWSTRKLKGFASAYTVLQDKFKQKYKE